MIRRPRPLPGLGPGADAARQVRRHHPVNHAAAAPGGHQVRQPGDLPAPASDAAGPRFARSRARFAMPSPPMPVVTCPGPGGPVTFSSAIYVTYHVTVNVTVT